jgi:hypothetical protein
MRGSMVVVAIVGAGYHWFHANDALQIFFYWEFPSRHCCLIHAVCAEFSRSRTGARQYLDGPYDASSYWNNQGHRRTQLRRGV